MEKKWENRFMMMAEQVGRWSKQETKVGAIVVGEDRRLKGCGYNGPPANYLDNNDIEPPSFVVIHAEVNALQNSDGDGLTLFVSSQPCLFCAAAIVASRRVKKVVMPKTGSAGRWSDSQQLAVTHLQDNQIEVVYNG